MALPDFLICWIVCNYHELALKNIILFHQLMQIKEPTKSSIYSTRQWKTLSTCTRTETKNNNSEKKGLLVV